MSNDDKYLLGNKQDDDEIRLVTYWLGTPCKWHDSLTHLPPGLPESDLGGRALFMPVEETPGSLFDRTMPQVAAIVSKADRDVQMGMTPNGARHPFGFLGQGIQLNWLFTAHAFSEQQSRMADLEQRVAQLEALLKADTTEPAN